MSDTLAARLLRGYAVLTRLYRASGAGCVLAMIVILLASIALREIAGVALVWANEVSITLFVWAVFMGAGVAIAENAHIRFHLLVQQLPVFGHRTVDLVVSYVGLVLIAGFWTTSIYVAYVYRDQRFTTINASALWQWSAVPTGMSLAIAGWIRHGKWRWKDPELTEKPEYEIPGT